MFRYRAAEPKARNFSRWGAEDGGLRAPQANFGEFLLANTLKNAWWPANVTVRLVYLGNSGLVAFGWYSAPKRERLEIYGPG